MRRGISPIVSVVLLIAIAVVAAVGLYFFAGGLATKQATPETPIAISATAIDAAGGKIAVANLGSQPLTLSYLNTADGGYCNFTTEVTIPPNEQAVCTMPPRPGTSILYGSGTGQAVVILPAGEIAPVTFQTSYNSSTWTDTGTGTFTNTSAGSVRMGVPGWNGLPGAEALQINNAAGDQIYPSVGVDSNGVVHTAWQGNGIHYANSSSNWTDVTVYTGANAQNDPVLAIDTNDVVHIIWSGFTDGPADSDIYYANSSTGWTAVKINDGARYQSYPSLAIGPGNVLHATWQGDTDVAGDDNIYYANSSSGWTQVTVNNSAGDQWHPAIAAGSNGVVHIVWEHGDSTLHYANSSTGWAGGNITDNAVTFPLSPAIAAGPDGTAHVAYSDAGTGQIFYTNSSSGWAGHIVSQWPGHQCTDSPQIAVATSGIVHLLWAGGEWLGGMPGMCGQSYEILYDNTTDGDWSWMWNTPITDSVAVEDNFPSLALDADNTAHAAWTGNGDGDFDIQYSSPKAYYHTGKFVSVVRDTNFTPARFTSVQWTGTTSGASALTLQLYFSNWSNFSSNISETVTNPDTTISTAARYVRYWLNLTSNLVSTPVFSSVTIGYRDLNAMMTYTVNSETNLDWVAINRTCGAVNSTVVNATGLSGYFYTNTITNRTDCGYWVIYGRGGDVTVEEIE